MDVDVDMSGMDGFTVELKDPGYGLSDVFLRLEAVGGSVEINLTHDQAAAIYEVMTPWFAEPTEEERRG